jgi:hypothetical protein
MNQRRRATGRRPGIRATVGLVVEGDAEYVALPLLHTKKLLVGCPPLRPANLHGVGADRSAIGIAKLVAPKVIAHLAAGRHQVLVCIDREQRPTCVPQLARDIYGALRRELELSGKQVASVQVVLADRTFEAWLLADAQGLHDRGVFPSAPAFHSFEGELGRQHQKGVVELSTLLRRPYVKTVDGPRLFASLSLVAARNHRNNGRGSKSLDRLLRLLQTVG